MPAAPWSTGEAIRDAILRHAAAPDSAFGLPDEAPRDPARVAWGAGSLEGVLGHHGADLASGSRRDGAEQADPATVLGAALDRLARGDAEGRSQVYAAADNSALLGAIDPVLERLLDGDRARLAALAPEARWLITESRHRGPLKLGIALLGVTSDGNPDDVQLIADVAGHDEFTLYAAVAFTNLLDDPVDALWLAARQATGWGKIQAVERLAPRAGDRPDVQRWLLTNGTPNAVMDEYLALICATAGGLADALAGPVDDALLDGACRIAEVLCDGEGGPAEAMSDYGDGAVVVDRLLAQLNERCTTLPRLAAVVATRRWLRNDHDGGEPSRAAEDRWSSRADLIDRCAVLIARPQWRHDLPAAFETGDESARELAWRLAPHVGVDLWEAGFGRLTTDPLNAGWVYRLVSVDDRRHQRRVIDWALGALPLDDLPAGPANHLLATDEASRALQYVVQEMTAAELYAPPLVVAALRSPVVGLRNAALRAVAAQPRASWGDDVESAVRQVAGDPNDRASEHAGDVLDARADRSRWRRWRRPGASR